jgi:hypothetical protein
MEFDPYPVYDERARKSKMVRAHRASQQRRGNHRPEIIDVVRFLCNNLFMGERPPITDRELLNAWLYPDQVPVVTCPEIAARLPTSSATPRDPLLEVNR